MKVAIKNPAPLGPNLEKWGDYHFGLSLARALTDRGVEVVQHFWPNWESGDEDVEIVLRGKRKYSPNPKKLSLMWVISHPATVQAAEMASYDMVFVASELHYRQIAADSQITVDVARQCTDINMFNQPAGAADRRGISFIANSRGIKRDILTWAVEAGVPVELTGRHWKGVGLGGMVRQEFIANDQLPDHYRSTRLTLNDHWGDMSYFGYINNRIFDCLATGTPIISDAFPELRDLCGDALLYASDAATFRQSLQNYYLAYPDLIGGVADLWSRIGANYSFDARAEQIIEWASKTPAKRKPRRSAAILPLQQRAPLNHPAKKMADAVNAAIQDLREAGVQREIQALHVFPTPDGTTLLFDVPDISYLAAGPGSGPWHLTTDNDMASVADGRFDLIVIEDTSLFDRAADPTRLASILVSKLSKQGMILAPSGAEKTYFADFNAATLPGIRHHEAIRWGSRRPIIEE